PSFSSPSRSASTGTDAPVPTSARLRQAVAFSSREAFDCNTAISLASTPLAGPGASCPDDGPATASSSAARPEPRRIVVDMGRPPSIGGCSDDVRLTLGTGTEAIGLGVVDELDLDRVVLQVALQPHADIGRVDRAHRVVHHVRAGHGLLPRPDAVEE